jgi:hypothetical protein
VSEHGNAPTTAEQRAAWQIARRERIAEVARLAAVVVAGIFAKGTEPEPQKIIPNAVKIARVIIAEAERTEP